MADDEEVPEPKNNAPPELALDSRDQTGFVSWYRSLPQEAQKIRFFDRKTFYSVHGDDALFIARQYYRTTAVVKHLGSGGSEKGLASVTLNRNLFESVLRDLLLEGADHSVELWDGSGASWKVVRSASPGRLDAFSEELFKSGAELADAPIVIAVAIAVNEGVRTVGVAYCDMVGRQLGVSEFVDDEGLCTLEAVVTQLGAKEAVVVKDVSGGKGGEEGGASHSSDARRLQDLMDRCGALATARPKAFFAAKNLESDLGKLVKTGGVEHHADVLERRLACGALAAVLAYCEVLSDSSGHKKWGLSLYDAKRYMRLDAAAQRALNVFPNRTDTSASFSLLGLMARGRTPMGKRRARAWLKQPLVDAEQINGRLDVVQALVEDGELRERLRDSHLRGLPDVERLVRKLDTGRGVTLADLCALYRASARLPLIEDSLRAHEGPARELLATRFADPLATAHDDEHLAKFEQLVEAAVDLERVPDEYLIAPAYDDRLAELAADKGRAEKAISKLAADAAADLGLQLDKTIKLEWHKAANTRTRCLRITQKEERAVRGKLNKYRTLCTNKEGVRFTNKALEAAAAELSKASQEYEELQRELVQHVVEVARTFVEVWEGVAGLLAELDALAGFADLAATAPTPYVRPQVVPAAEGAVVLEGCRHPCVEAQDGVEFIKNDCDLVRGRSWFTLITGPNMGGKSTYIRQVGVAVLMAQAGCFVACDAARISVRDAIFARVGAGDCQQRGVSTFMAEMLETAAILKGATSSSLVIIDELGRGTSTYDGFGLAWAISEHIMERVGAPTLFATHFHELTEITGSVGVANRHVSAVVDPASGRLTMLYQIKDGACDQSFGIQVAESASFPAEVVSLARAKLAELEGTEVAGLKAVGAKRRREQAQEEAGAVERAKRFLHDFSAIQGFAAEGGCGDALAAAQQLLKGLEAEAASNPALARMLAAC